ncbi:hypothetical protein NE237_026441 [Protea cynaroides]|uniref:Uncharacterized protein n=1 Tax=Protea cynaroides TaxID=273540 RepID=A0A9Q0K2A8_9MAGN|nr:hypothetical protein NE237_026441 [Protea cynaroides]
MVAAPEGPNSPVAAAIKSVKRDDLHNPQGTTTEIRPPEIEQLCNASQGHGRVSNGLAGAVPPSLGRITKVEAILQATNEIEDEDHNVARIQEFFPPFSLLDLGDFIAIASYLIEKRSADTLQKLGCRRWDFAGRCRLFMVVVVVQKMIWG